MDEQVLRLAAFADAHYARGRRFQGTRRADLALGKLRAIFRALPPVDLVLNLGDLVNASGSPQEDQANIQEIQEMLSAEAPAPVCHVLGNHDCQAGPKAAFLRAESCGAYAFDLQGVRFLVLDANFTHREESYEGIDFDWKDAWIPRAQLDWMRRQLDCAPGGAVVLCHQNLDDRGSDPHLVGNASAVRSLLEEYRERVLCVLQGHCHSGARSLCGGIPYITLPALCEGEAIPYALVEIRGRKVAVRELDARA